jgi:hypothetical protein
MWDKPAQRLRPIALAILTRKFRYLSLVSCLFKAIYAIVMAYQK